MGNIFSILFLTVSITLMLIKAGVHEKIMKFSQLETRPNIEEKMYQNFLIETVSLGS